MVHKIEIVKKSDVKEGFKLLDKSFKSFDFKLKNKKKK